MALFPLCLASSFLHSNELEVNSERDLNIEAKLKELNSKETLTATDGFDFYYPDINSRWPYNGDAYSKKINACFHFDESSSDGSKWSKSECSRELIYARDIKTKEYTDFFDYLEAFKECLRNENVECLRPLIYPHLIFDHGSFAGFGEKRDIFLRKHLKKDEMKVMLDLVEKIDVYFEVSKTRVSPLEVAHKITKFNIVPHFENKNGFWLLVEVGDPSLYNCQKDKDSQYQLKRNLYSFKSYL